MAVKTARDELKQARIEAELQRMKQADDALLKEGLPRKVQFADEIQPFGLFRLDLINDVVSPKLGIQFVCAISTSRLCCQ
jgi:hypothetical protein